MNDIGIFKTTYDVSNRIGLPNIGQKLITEALAFGRTGHQSSNIDKLNRGGHNPLRTHNLR